MDDATIRRKMAQIVKLSRELNDEAKRRWPDGWIFAEGDGGLHMMSGDADPDQDSISDRQEFIEFSAEKPHRLGVGAW